MHKDPPCMFSKTSAKRYIQDCAYSELFKRVFCLNQGWIPHTGQEANSSSNIQPPPHRLLSSEGGELIYTELNQVKFFVGFVISGLLGAFVILKFLMNRSRIGAHGRHWIPKLLAHHFHGTSQHFIKVISGVPVVAQRKWIWLVFMRMQVQSLAWLSGLRIWHCHKLWCRSQMQPRSYVAVAVAVATAIAQIRTLAWEPPYVMGMTLKSNKYIHTYIHMYIYTQNDRVFFCKVC